jgi:multicomponent Na+:H+ antiporter subunit D
VYALLRVLTLLVPPGVPGVFPLLLGGAALTMVIGVLAAVSRSEIRSILSFHILSQIGYMVVGIGLVGSGDPRLQELGVAATVFYIVHHILVKANLFLIGGAVSASAGSSMLSRTGGLLRTQPALAVLFLIPALSLAGIPPLSGFWAKLTVLQAGLEAGESLVVACALVAGLFTLLSMVKIWNEAFWKPSPSPAADEVTRRPVRVGVLRLVPIAGLAALTVAIGLYPEPLLRLAQRSAHELLAHRNGAPSAGAADFPVEEAERP